MTVYLIDYRTHEIIRPATGIELFESIEVYILFGGLRVIVVEGQDCYASGAGAG